MKYSRQKCRWSRSTGRGKKPRQPIVGYEYEPPTLDFPYIIYLGQGNAFKTSRVWEVEEVNDAFMIKTANSVYRLEYLEKLEL